MCLPARPIAGGDTTKTVLWDDPALVHQKLLYLPIGLIDQGRAVLRRARHGAIKLPMNPLEEEMELVNVCSSNFTCR